jgi:NADH-quinone oxidoreductase subunit J
MDVVLFWVFAIVSVGGGALVVLHRNPMNSAIALVVTMLCLVVYAGAVMVLMLFVIMMLNLRDDTLQREGRTSMWVLAGIIGLLVVWRLARLFPGTPPDLPAAPNFGSIEAVGNQLFSRYLLPFELTSVLLLIAIVGAVILAKRTTS